MLAAALAAGLTSGTAAGGPDRQPAGGRGEYLGAVTLLTGDHVTVRRVNGRLLPQVTAGPGRERVQFATVGAAGRLLVVPGDAAPLLNTGRLDERLFDVAALLRDGYGDAERADLPLLVRSGVDPAVAGGTVRDLSGVDIKAVRQPKDEIAALWAAVRDGALLARGADRVWLDGLRRPSLDVSVPQIGAPSAWTSGYTGRGVRVAVLDTGIDHTHLDFRGRLVAVRDFTGEGDPRDQAGHGTHVASILAGSGAASDGRYTGVAPDAQLLVGKVCGGRGCPESAILAGMQWAAGSGAKVVNLSLGGPDGYDDDPLEQAVAGLSDQYGTLFVVAAGNDGGYGSETVSSPASADAALAVGAVDAEDVLAGFSGRGPRVRDGALKPELVAPGVEITAARSRFSELGERKDRYTKLSGTSMASPHVAGAAAILAQRHPDWTGRQLKAALLASARPLDGVGGYEQGAGRVDVARAIDQTVYTEPAAVSLGRQAWPHADDQPVTRTVTYRNTGPAPVTLRLSLAAIGPDAAPAPEGMFAVSASALTVPARGQATVQVSANTAIPAADGAFSAWITASGDSGTVVTTPVAVDREPESYDLTLRHVDRTGTPTNLHYSVLFGVDLPRFRPMTGVGEGTVRVRKGRYHLDAVIDTPRPDGAFDSSKVVRPTVDVGADSTVTLDARTAAPVTVRFARPGVRPSAVGAGYVRFTGAGDLITGVLGDTFERIFTGQTGQPQADDDLAASIGGVWAVPDRHGDVTASPVTYNLAWFEHGRLPTGFTRDIVDGDLAEVVTTYRAQDDRKRATKVWIARDARSDITNGFGIGFRLPLTRTEYHNADGPGWSGEFQQWVFRKRAVHTETVLTGGVVDHRPGQSYVDSWNTAVFGPGFAGEDLPATRTENLLVLNLPLYADAGLDRTGLSELDSGSTVLYLGGTKLGETTTPGIGQFEVPAETAVYRLRTEAVRGAVSELSTRISCSWTFTSARPPEDAVTKGKGGVALPLMVIRFAPPGLDLGNRSRVDSARVPVTVQRQPDTPPVVLATLSVEASYDDGGTWRPVPVTAGPGDTATASVDHPRGARYVSLRARAADSAGNTVEQTFLRAYRI